MITVCFNRFCYHSFTLKITKSNNTLNTKIQMNTKKKFEKGLQNMLLYCTITIKPNLVNQFEFEFLLIFMSPVSRAHSKQLIFMSPVSRAHSKFLIFMSPVSRAHSKQWVVHHPNTLCIASYSVSIIRYLCKHLKPYSLSLPFFTMMHHQHTPLFQIRTFNIEILYMLIVRRVLWTLEKWQGADINV